MIFLEKYSYVESIAKKKNQEALSIFVDNSKKFASAAAVAKKGSDSKCRQGMAQ